MHFLCPVWTSVNTTRGCVWTLDSILNLTLHTAFHSGFSGSFLRSLLRDLSGVPEGNRILGWLEAFLYRHHCVDWADHEPRSSSAHASRWPFIRSFDTPQLLKTQAATSANSNLCLSGMFSLGPITFRGGQCLLQISLFNIYATKS